MVLLPGYFYYEINIIYTFWRLESKGFAKILIWKQLNKTVVHLFNHSHYAEYSEDLVKDGFLESGTESV